MPPITQEGLEWGLEYALTSTKVAGDVVWVSTTTNTYTSACSIVGGYAFLIAVAVGDIGAADLGISIAGSTAAGTACTWTGAILANACIDFGFKVTSACALSIGYITTITTSGGTSGDHFELVAIPGSASRTNLEYIRNLRQDDGTTYRAVPKDYISVDHVKRVRGSNTLSFESVRVTGQSGLSVLKDRRNLTLVARKDTDGDSTITESLVFEQVSGSLSNSNPLQNSGEVTDSYTGVCKRAIRVIADL